MQMMSKLKTVHICAGATLLMLLAGCASPERRMATLVRNSDASQLRQSLQPLSPREKEIAVAECVRQKKPDMLRALLADGLRPKQEDLLVSVMNGDLDITRMLLVAGLNADYRFPVLVWRNEAAFTDTPERLGMSTRRDPVPNGPTALQVAVPNGPTALQFAVQSGNIPMIQLLLASGANAQQSFYIMVEDVTELPRRSYDSRENYYYLRQTLFMDGNRMVSQPTYRRVTPKQYATLLNNGTSGCFP